MSEGWSSVRIGCMCLVLVLILSGCATGKDPKDPLEPFNRGVFKFNQTLDSAVLRPVAVGYTKAVPVPIRGGIDSFLSNLRDIPVAVNDLLQGKFRQAANDSGRFVVNSSIGILGFFDVATRIGLIRHDEDFGQTFGYWGIGPGPYLMLPLLGPSTLRDTAGTGVDLALSPSSYVFEEPREGLALFGARVVNQRAQLLDSDRLLDEAALDKYSFIREAYLQRRESLIQDQAGPDSKLNPKKPRKTLKELEEELEEGDVNGGPAAAPR